MNEQVTPPSPSVSDAHGVGVRRRFTADEFERMAREGILDHDERLELIEGDIHVMSAKGRRHEVLRSELFLTWASRRPAHLKVASETPLRLSDDTEPVPDLIVYPAHLVAPDVRADTVLLVVEIADSSLAYDQRRKASVYAANGVPEYWVVNAKTLETRVHTDPTADGYRHTTEIPGNTPVMPAAAPDLAIRMVDVDG